MSRVLERRIARLEVLVKPTPDLRMVVLREPADDAAEAVHAAFLLDVAQAETGHDRVWVIGFRLTQRERVNQRTVYLPSELDATLCMLAHQKSAGSNGSRLEDVLECLVGNTVGPAGGVAWLPTSPSIDDSGDQIEC